MTIHGSCLCQGVRYAVEGELSFPGYCHCSICRKTHGSAFGSYATVKPENFRWVAGEDLLRKYQSSPYMVRCFCSRCGSPLAGVADHEIGVTLGSLGDDPGVRPIAHIFVGSKAPWFEITDELMQFEGWPPGMEPGTAT